MSRLFAPADVQHYPVHSGLFAGEYPGATRQEAALQRLQQMADTGVRTFIDLTTPEDAALGLAPYAQFLESVTTPDGQPLRYQRFAIPDMGIPADDGTMHGAFDLIRSEIAAGRPCYVHCWGGIGRTGTAVGCWLVEEGGMTPDAALARVQELYSSHMSEEKRARYPHSPQQPRQLDYVRGWPEAVRSRQSSAASQPAE